MSPFIHSLHSSGLFARRGIISTVRSISHHCNNIDDPVHPHKSILYPNAVDELLSSIPRLNVKELHSEPTNYNKYNLGKYADLLKKLENITIDNKIGENDTNGDKKRYAIS